MSAYIVIPLIVFILIIIWMSVYTFDKRFNRTRVLQTRAAAAQNPAIIYTIPTNAPTLATQPNTGGSILYPNRTTTYFAPSTDLPPSYDDVTKDSPVIVNLSSTEAVASPPTTTTPIATTTTTTTSTTTAAFS